MKSKKQLAAKLLKTSPKKVKFAADALPDIKKAITRSDVRGLIAVNKITVAQKNEQSRARARVNLVQKRKGRQKGHGSRKGAKYSRVPKKTRWVTKIRAQRAFLKLLKKKEIISSKEHADLYRKSKGGFFRNKRHIKLSLTDRDKQSSQ